MGQKISKWFTDKEFQCQGHGCCKKDTLPTKELLDALDALRELVGLPIVVTSGVRCEAHNKAIGGAAESYHVKGMAADIYVPRMDMKILQKVIENSGLFGGIGVYKSWIHVDVRKGKARWQK